MPEKKGRALMTSVGRIVECWVKTPSEEFLIGPDVWKPHRHPLSDDGAEVRAALASWRRKGAESMVVVVVVGEEEVRGRLGHRTVHVRR